MKLYNSVGPNPHVVRMFMAERGIEIPTEDIDIMVGANRQPDYLEKNPHGQSPALFLDDGSLITEITAICEYLDETNPGDSLIGSTPEERAQTRRWTRWVDLKIVEPMTTAFIPSLLRRAAHWAICCPSSGFRSYRTSSRGDSTAPAEVIASHTS